MSSSTDAQRLIALSLGKIAMSRQQRGGINLHKNLLVASVLHKARTTYMMDNFHTLLANKRAQAEKEAAAKMIVETPVVEKTEEKTSNNSVEVSVQSRGLTECSITSNSTGAPHGVHQATGNTSILDKENMVPVNENNAEESKICDRTSDLEQKSCARDNVSNSAPVVSGKAPLSEQNNNLGQLASCRCVGGKRRRSFVTENDSVTEPKKARYEEENDCVSDSESEYDSDSSDCVDSSENMQTESSQVTSLVDIFNTGFNGLCKEAGHSQPTGHINVYVSADRSVTGHQYVLKDISCGTLIKDNVAIPTAIALAV